MYNIAQFIEFSLQVKFVTNYECSGLMINIFEKWPLRTKLSTQTFRLLLIVSINAVCSKLKRLGFRDKFLNWLNSCLVETDDTTSASFDIIFGVLQEGCLCPLIFYINLVHSHKRSPMMFQHKLLEADLIRK